jgi:Bacterial SH3 domain
MRTKLLTYMLILCIVCACTNQSKSQKPLVYRARVDNLRLRQDPNVTSKVLYTVNENEEVYYIDEKTIAEETIKMRGGDRTESWYKVKTKTGVVGWVFGGGLHLEEEINKSDISTQKKQFKKMSANTLSKILDLDIESDYPNYHGYYEYYKTLNATEILHGQFSIKQVERVKIDEGFYDNLINIYTGSFVNGTKTGKFTHETSFYEGGHTSSIVFGENGKCDFSKIERKAEGDVMKYRIESPSECTFEFIEKESDKHGKSRDVLKGNTNGNSD